MPREDVNEDKSQCCVSQGVLVAKVRTIASFGDSFIYGSELQDNKDGSRAWPGLIAQELGCNYTTLAVVGCTNEAIARQIFTYFSAHDTQDTLAVINWTWCMRWDFYLQQVKEWVGLGPTCAPEKLKDQLDRAEATELIKFYNTHVDQAHAWNQYRSLQAIMSAQRFLDAHGIKNIQTYMDRELFMPPMAPSRLEHYHAFRDAAWPNIVDESQLDTLPEHIRLELDQDYNSMADPEYIQVMQKMTWTAMQDFDGQTFLEWSRSRGYEVTPPPGDHPLEQAHQAAAEYWKTQYQQQLQ
jgi:hypothetical protein